MPRQANVPDDYQIALRHDDMGLDDVVVKDVAMFRMERMDDDYVWLACYLVDGQEIVFDLWREKKKILYKTREPLPNVVYEEKSEGAARVGTPQGDVAETCHICRRRRDEPGELWCSAPHPMIEAEVTAADPDRFWLIHFEDSDVPYEVFTNEESARGRSKEIGSAWNHTLFVEVKRD